MTLLKLRRISSELKTASRHGRRLAEVLGKGIAEEMLMLKPRQVVAKTVGIAVCHCRLALVFVMMRSEHLRGTILSGIHEGLLFLSQHEEEGDPHPLPPAPGPLRVCHRHR